MAVKGTSKRRLQKQLRYALDGIALGLSAALSLITGTVVGGRWMIGKPLGHRIPAGFIVFTIFLMVALYRTLHIQVEPSRRERASGLNAMTELSTGGDKKKSA